MTQDIVAVGLDIGTSKVRCVVGVPAESGQLEIIGTGAAESKGVRRGIVTSSETVAESIRKAIEEAERGCDFHIGSATINLSGEHFRGENKNGVVAVAGAGREITEEDVNRAIESASAISLPVGWEIVSRLAQEFIVDGQDGIIEPIGMTGSRLEALAHVVVSPGAGRQNLEKAVSRADVDVEKLLLEPLAAAESALTDDDREYGCALVNIGVELTSVMIFQRGAVQFTAVFPYGGMHLTKDIAHGLRVSIADANQLKHKFGCVAPFLLDAEEKQEMIEIVPVGKNETRGLSKEILCDIMYPRGTELLQLVAHEITSSGVPIPSGVVITGGGSLVRGLTEIGEQIFDAPTRIGFPEVSRFAGLINEVQNPEWAVACGLALSSMKGQVNNSANSTKSPGRRMVEWIEHFREKFR